MRIERPVRRLSTDPSFRWAGEKHHPLDPTAAPMLIALKIQR